MEGAADAGLALAPLGEGLEAPDLRGAYLGKTRRQVGKMGQGWSEDAAEDGRVAKAEEALDELVWDASDAINQDKVQRVLDDCGIKTKTGVTSVREAMLAKHHEQHCKYEFYRDKVGECSDGSYACTKFMMFHCAKRSLYTRVCSYLSSIENLEPKYAQ